MTHGTPQRPWLKKFNNMQDQSTEREKPGAPLTFLNTILDLILSQTLHVFHILDSFIVMLTCKSSA